MFNLYFDCSARNNHHYTDLKVCSHCLLFAIEIGHGKEGCGHEFSTVMPSFFFFFLTYVTIILATVNLIWLVVTS